MIYRRPKQRSRMILHNMNGLMVSQNAFILNEKKREGQNADLGELKDVLLPVNDL